MADPPRPDCCQRARLNEFGLGRMHSLGSVREPTVMSVGNETAGRATIVR